MAIHITDDTMTLEIDDRVVATAMFSERTAGGGNGACIVSTDLARLFTRDQAITALTVAELGRTGTRPAIRSWPHSGRRCDD